MSCQITLLLNLALCTVVLGKHARIVGGEIASINEFPYMVSLRFFSDNKLRCGGSIVSKKHVLTAAHCLIDVPIYDLVMYAGTNSSTDTRGVQYTAKRIKIHPQYNNTFQALFQHDIAVITIRGVFVFNDIQKSIKLPTKNIIGEERGIIIGWGKEEYTHINTSEHLRVAPMTILKRENCLSTLPFIMRMDQFCALEALNVGPCVGDSGGPLIINGKIIGIASFVLPCATGVPDVYTNVYGHLEFIKSEIYSTWSLFHCAG